MPKLWQSNIKERTLTGLWKITEEPEELSAMLQNIAPREFPARQRTLHWLASRVLLEDLLAEMGIFRFDFEYDAFGKPCVNVDKLDITISHAGEYAAIAVSEAGPVGVDIEKVSPRIERIHHKFMNPPELARLTPENRHEWMSLVWAAKEALFKFYSRGELDFKEHLFVEEAGPSNLNVRIAKPDFTQMLNMEYRFFEGYVMALVGNY